MLGPPDLVICSLEAWDDVWRRNQFLVDGLLRRHPRLRVLYVEPPVDLWQSLRRGRVPPAPTPQPVGADGRLLRLRPWKPLPRRLGPYADVALRWQVRRQADRQGLRAPVLWINDLTYAPLIGETRWPSVHDITDDWLLEPVGDREHARRQAMERILMEQADEVVVCSPGLRASRGRQRPVTVVANGVDVAHFRRPRPRPADLPPPPVAVYPGTLHDERIDIELVAELARSLPQLNIVLVGPDALSPSSGQRLHSHPNIHRLGPRPYASLPGYYQHAELVLIPHRVTPFTESLDPIKAYECLAIGTPTVATEIAGFRGRGDNILTAPRSRYVNVVAEVLAAPPPPAAPPVEDISWRSRVIAFEAVLERASQRDRYRRVTS